MGIRVEVWGERALFTMPSFKSERVSYKVMTPSAARGIIESIYWHPGLRWVIKKIQVCEPVRYTTIMRNEVSAKISSNTACEIMKKGKGMFYLDAPDARAQRQNTILRDVRYVIDAYFEMTDKANPKDSPDKFMGIISDRLKLGKCYRQPCFGCREYPAYFQKAEGEYAVPEELKGEMDLGVMLYDMDYSDEENIKPMFYIPKMTDGIITVPHYNSSEILRYGNAR